MRRPLSLLAGLSALVILGQACGAPPPARETSAVPPTAPPTETRIHPSPTVEVKLPAEWPISLAGPWLVYLSDEGLMAANPDGSGRTLLVEADRLGPAHLYDFDALAAPSGARLAVYTFDDPGLLSKPSLQIVHIPDGLAPWSTRLLSPSVEALVAGGEDARARAAGEAVTLPGSVAWAPDGRRLAFVAALDGPSSDLYVYDLDQTSVRRVTSGPNQMASLSWSPDGAWIAHQAVEDFGSGAGWVLGSVWTVSPDGRQLNKLYTPASGGEIFVGWSTGDSLISYSFTPEGFRDIRAAGADGAVENVLVPSAIGGAAYDPASGTIAYAVPQDLSPSGAEAGAYLWNPLTGSRQIDAGDWSTVQWSEAAGRFYFEGSGGVLGATPQGNTVSVPVVDRVSPSPDGRHVALWGDGYWNRESGIRIYTSDLELEASLEPFDVGVVSWRPDSAGLMAMTEAGLTYYPLDGPALVVDPSATATIEGGLGWVLP